MKTNEFIKGLWECKLELSDGSFKFDKELINLFFLIFCKNKCWTAHETEIFSKIKYYHQFYNGKLMYYKIRDIKKLLKKGLSVQCIEAQLD